MKLFQFHLPPHPHAQRQWEALAIVGAGGFTRQAPVIGAWNDKAGDTIIEPMVVYQVACDLPTFEKLLASAFSLWPREQALFTVDVGEAFIHAREGHRLASNG